MLDDDSPYATYARDLIGEEMPDRPNQLVYSTNSIYDLMANNIIKKRVEELKHSIFYKFTTLIVLQQPFFEFLEKEFPDFQFICEKNKGVLIDKITEDLIIFNCDKDQTSVKVYGDKPFTEKVMSKLADFEKMKNYIKWVYSDRGDYIEIPMTSEKSPVAEMYPFLNGETLESYYDRYMKSSANILLLIGPPGTGKTTFIRGLLQHTGQSGIVTYNDSMLNNDSVFADFIGGDDTFMVMEDADTYLESRTEGNTMMHRFLNVADGLVTTKGKKMIFSTNLSSTNDIDQALIRPGRCHDVVHFKNLNEEQATKLAIKLNMSFDGTAEEFSVAEIFHKKEPKLERRKIGFQIE